MTRALSPREVEILDLLKKGLFPIEIANSLKLSIKTVDAHKMNIHKKLNLEPRTTILQGLARQQYAVVINSPS